MLNKVASFLAMTRKNKNTPQRQGALWGVRLCLPVGGVLFVELFNVRVFEPVSPFFLILEIPDLFVIYEVTGEPRSVFLVDCVLELGHLAAPSDTPGVGAGRPVLAVLGRLEPEVGADHPAVDLALSQRVGTHDL